MCRIFGLVDDALRHEQLDDLGHRMCALLHHGGPDGRHHAVLGDTLIGSTRLAISDPENGSQPFRGHGWVVVFNGELYDVESLRARLAEDGVRLATRCDGEVLPHLLARYGSDLSQHLDGEYAIAAHHAATGRLLLLRDPAGVKPLYFFADADRLGFASEIGALLALRGRPAVVDLDGLERFFRLKAVYGARAEAGCGDPTAVVGLQSLPPGHLLERRGGDLEIRPSAPTSTRTAPGEAAALVERRLPSAVAGMLPPDVPWCTVVSGGLDSAVVTHLAVRSAALRRPQQPRAFTVVPTGAGPDDELRFAELVARANDLDLVQVPVGAGDIAEELPAVVRSLGQPNSDPITLSTYRLFRAVRAGGFPVALTGDASDEVFGGYDRLRDLTRTGDVEAYRRALSGVPAGWLDTLWHPDAALEVEKVRRPDDAPWADTAASGPAERDPAEAAISFELRHRLPVYHLQRVDHLSAAHAVEARVPFCRERVREVGRSSRAVDKIGPDGQVKVALAAATRRRGWAPAAVLDRPKQPFTFRLADHLLADGGVGLAWAREVLTDPSSARGWFVPGRVRATLDSLEASGGERTAHAVWALLVCELWMREVVEGSAP